MEFVGKEGIEKVKPLFNYASDGSNFVQQSTILSGKKITVELNGVIKEIDIPTDWIARPKISPSNGKVTGVFFDSPDGTKFIQLNNPTTYPYEYASGYMKHGIYMSPGDSAKVVKNYLTIDGVNSSSKIYEHFNILSTQ